MTVALEHAATNTCSVTQSSPDAASNDTTACVTSTAEEPTPTHTSSCERVETVAEAAAAGGDTPMDVATDSNQPLGIVTDYACPPGAAAASDACEPQTILASSIVVDALACAPGEAGEAIPCAGDVCTLRQGDEPSVTDISFGSCAATVTTVADAAEVAVAVACVASTAPGSASPAVPPCPPLVTSTTAQTTRRGAMKRCSSPEHIVSEKRARSTRDDVAHVTNSPRLTA